MNIIQKTRTPISFVFLILLLLSRPAIADQMQNSGHFIEGVRIVPSMNKDRKLIVSSIFRNSPAQRKGIMPGDVILKINNTPAASMSLVEVDRLFEGSPGTTIDVQIERDGSKISVEMVSERMEISLDTVPLSDIPEGKIIRLYQDSRMDTSKEFDKLFSTKTGYEELDERIAKTSDKKEELLMVLKYPEIPLHNNQSELGARAQVRRRNVSLQTKTDEGTKASDTFMTIVQTAKKLGISAYDYIFDRVGKEFKLPSLADIIKTKTVASNVCPFDGG